MDHLTNGVDGDKLDKTDREQNEHKSKKHPQDVLRRYVSHQDKTQYPPGWGEGERERKRSKLLEKLIWLREVEKLNSYGLPSSTF